MTKFFFKFKKIYFWPISQFWGQKKLFQKILLCHTQHDKGFQYHAKIQRNLMTQFQENTQTERTRKDGQNLFHRTILATTEGPTNTIAVNQHLKLKDREYNVDLTKNYYIIVGMQKISSINKLIFIIQQILGSHELNGHTHF